MSGERIAKAGLVSLIGGGTGAVFGLLLAVVVGRGLGPEGTGYFFQLVALFMIMANIFELGADTGLVRELSKQVSLGRVADLGRTVIIAIVPVVLIGMVAVTALWFFALPLAGLISAPEAAGTTATLIVNTAGFVLLASLLAVLLGATRGLGGVLPFVGILNIALPVTRVLTVLAVISGGLGLLAAARAWAWPLVVACAAAAVILVRQLARLRAGDASRHDPVPPPTPTRALVRTFWGFSAPRAVAAALEIGLQWADVLIVAAVLGPTEAGIYAVVSRAARSGLLVETAMRMAVSPRISATLATGDVPAATDLHRNATRSMILLSWPLYLTLAMFGPAILPVFGAGFAAGASALAVLCAAMMLLSAAGMVQTVLLMGGRSHWQMSNKAVALGINLAGNLLLVPHWGIVGAAVAWLLTVAVDSALATWQVHRLMAIRVAVSTLALPIQIVACTVAVPGLAIRAILGPTPIALAVHLLIAGVLFVVACWRLRDRLGLDALGGVLAARLRGRPRTLSK